jgi:mevalonate kinase
MRNLLLIPVALLTLTACLPTAEDPKSVADKYWQSMQTGNQAEAEKLVTINSRRYLASHKDRMATITQLDNGDARTIVSTTITTINPETGYEYEETFDTVLVMEQGQWKVDIRQTEIPPSPVARQEELDRLAEELNESMQENIESIDEAMNEGMHMLNEALQEGSKDMSESLLRLMDELNESMHESIEQMKKRRQQQLEEQQQQEPTTPDPEKGEGMI